MTMDWQGIAALLAVGVSALSAELNFRQQSYNKQQEYLIRNNYIPVGNFSCMNILGLLFIRKKTELNNTVINHEAIHTAQPSSTTSHTLVRLYVELIN